MQPCMNCISMYKWDIQSQDARYIWGELTHYDSWVPVQHGDGSQDGFKLVAESVITEQLDHDGSKLAKHQMFPDF